MLIDSEISPRVLAAYARAVEELPDDATARPFANAVVVGFTDAVAEFDCSTEVSAVVTIALQVYQHPSIVPPSPGATRISRTWHIVDEDHPGLRGRALDDVRRHGAASGCLTYLWNGPDVAEVLDQLISTAPSLDEKLALVSHRTGIFHHDDTALLEILSTALSEFDFDVTLRAVDCLNMDSTSVGDAERGALRRIVDETPADDDRDPFGRRAVACIVVAGRYGDDATVVNILSRPNTVAAVDSSQNEPRELGRGLILGRAALASYLAGEPAHAAHIAHLQLAESGDMGGWSTAGEDILAGYVLGILETDPTARAQHFAAATKIARHGQITPLFARLFFEAASAALDEPEPRTSGLDVVNLVGYGRYLEFGASPTPEGHFWNPVSDRGHRTTTARRPVAVGVDRRSQCAARRRRGSDRGHSRRGLPRAFRRCAER